MRITLVTHYYPAHRGGIELVAAALAKRLADRGDVHISWYASDCDPTPSLAGVNCVPAKTWNMIEQRFGVPYPLWSPGALWRVWRAARAADVVHLHDCLYLPNVVAYAAARLARRPVLVTQHVGMIPYRNPVLRALMYAAYRILARIVLGGATQVAFVSESVRRYFGEFVSFRSPPELVFNGVDTDVFKPVDAARRQALRADFGVAPDTPLLIFVGRFVEKKGLLVLQQLAQSLPGARWIFAGWGPLDPERWALPNVSVVRGCAGAQLATLYQAADLLVLPSRGEGFPLVVQEAMACGTPALVTTDTAEGCPDAAAVLPSEDVRGADAVARWVHRILELTAAGGAAQRLRPMVSAYAAANWSWGRCAERYAELFARCSRV